MARTSTAMAAFLALSVLVSSSLSLLVSAGAAADALLKASTITVA